jgi:MFS family permease
MTTDRVFTTDVPARLDRLPWGRFHWLVIAALGITWILDGLEVTVVGSLSGVLADPRALGLSASEIGLSASAYITGAVLGALFFGDLTDRFGRKRLFLVTLGVYLVATVATGLSWNFWSFALFRALTGAGIGGEYAAVNSAIDEFIPARRRGFAALAINGSFWIGAALGALTSLVVLDPNIFPVAIGWRFAFALGGAMAFVILFIRRFVPESPRWLMTHGHPEEAARIVSSIEASAPHHADSGAGEAARITLRPRPHRSFPALGSTLLLHYPKRTLLSLTLMATQAFCYNAIFFTYALILTRFYGVAPANIGWFMLPFALGNFLGPLLLGPLFDSVGRKPMIAATYGISGALMALTGYLFAQGVLSAAEQTAAWMVIFFFASAGASAAYLTVSECFPLETRAMAIALFYAIGTALGGIAGPAIFGALIENGARDRLMWGYAFGGALMLLAAGVELLIGVAAECRPLESVAPPLSQAD